MLATHWLVVSWALGIVVSDTTSRRIPNVFSLGAVACGLVYLIYFGYAPLGDTWLHILLGIFLALTLTLPAYLARWIGAGDVKLLLAIATLGGWKAVVTSFAIAGLLGGFTTLGMMQYSTYTGRNLPTGRWLPFGAMLAMGFIVSMGVEW